MAAAFHDVVSAIHDLLRSQTVLPQKLVCLSTLSEHVLNADHGDRHRMVRRNRGGDCRPDAMDDGVLLRGHDSARLAGRAMIFAVFAGNDFVNVDGKIAKSSSGEVIVGTFVREKRQ